MLPSTLEDVVDGVREGQTIEYKSDFYRLTCADHSEKVRQHEEMLKDVSSFANTLGGDLIIGIKEQDGVAEEVCGFDVSAGVDGIKRRVLDNVQRWLEPRVALAIHVVSHSAATLAVLVNFCKFWARHSSIICVAGMYFTTYSRRQPSDLVEDLARSCQ